MWSLLSTLALAQDPPLDPIPAAPRPVLELTGDKRISTDVDLFVRSDGNLYLDDQLILRADLERILVQRQAEDPEARVVISGDTGAPYESLVSLVQLTQQLGIAHTALEVDGLELAAPIDPLFPKVDDEVEPLDGGLTPGQTGELRPKRHRFPQNPYANTASFTAYTLERGETKIGLGSVTYGIVPRVQIGTTPAFDLVGAANLNVKANLTREGRFDGALLAQYYYVPVQGLLGTLGFDEWFDGSQDTTATVHASYLGLGATGSFQIVRPWSVHANVYWARPSATGAIRFDDLPEALLPGLSFGDTAMVGLGVSADLGVLNLATDYRFNRRDSVYAWVRYPFFGRLRGLTNGSVEGAENLSNADLIVAYGDWVPFGDSYSIAVGYQGSWKHVDARVGLGASVVPGFWLLQAFELSYRFGGETRRTEREIRRGFQERPE